MNKQSKLTLMLCLFVLLSLSTGGAAFFTRDTSYGKIRSSVIKIYVTVQSENYLLPWQSGHLGKGNGTGFLISGKRILTNAHVVSNAKFIEVQRDGDPKRYPAKRKYVGHDCDISIIEVDAPEFYDGLAELELAEKMPELNDEVIVIGYPMGGDRISLTKGVVSRMDYSVYSHSMVDEHLVMQVDAAINPGNSGGPIFMGSKVVGIAFQGFSRGENIGYGIPLPVIQHFMRDIEDGEYNEYPEFGIEYLELRNKALKRSLGIPEGETGIVVSYVNPFGSAFGAIKDKDVVLSIDGYKIYDDGTINLEGYSVQFSELFERKQVGQSVTLDVVRDGKRQMFKVPLKKLSNPFVFRNLYDQKPRFFIKGGLVFAPLNREILESLGTGVQGDRKKVILSYISIFTARDSLYAGRDEFVLMIKRLPHEVNSYHEEYVNGVVEEINGKRIGNLQQAKEAFSHPISGYHKIKFMNNEECLIMDADAMNKADKDIFANYAITKTENLEEKK